MHGMIFSELRRYIEARLGSSAWRESLAAAGLNDRLYLVAQQFPDSEFQSLVAATAVRMEIAVSAVLEGFGEYLAPDLLRMHAHSVRPEWRTLDLIEHTEAAIHQVVRESGTDARPPEIATERRGPRELAVIYVSPRKLCSLAKGIVRGIAAHYDERPRITETTCMLQGAERCTIEIMIDPV